MNKYRCLFLSFLIVAAIAAAGASSLIVSAQDLEIGMEISPKEDDMGENVIGETDFEEDDLDENVSLEDMEEAACMVYSDGPMARGAFNQGPIYSSGTHVFSGYISNVYDWHIHGNFYGNSVGIYYNCIMTENDFYEIACIYSSDATVYVYSGDYVCNRKPYSWGGEGVFYMMGGTMVLGAMPAEYEYLLKNDNKVAGVDYKVENGLCINLNNDSLKIHGSAYHGLSNPSYDEYRMWDDQPYAAVTLEAEGPAKVSMYAGKIYWCSSSAINLDFDFPVADNYFYGYGGMIYECSNYAITTSGFCRNVELDGLDMFTNYNGIKIYENCNMHMAGNTIIRNMVNNSVENYGTILMDGGQIYGNSYGIENYGTLIQKGRIYNNTLYDVKAMGGRYENYNQTANVYLAKGQLIHGMAKPENIMGYVAVEPSDIYLGRVVYQVEYGENETAKSDLLKFEKSDKYKAFFDVENTDGNLEKRDIGVVRGNGVSGKSNQLVLSVPIKVSYFSSRESRLPYSSDTWWATDVTVSKQVPTYFLDYIPVNGSFIFKGWDMVSDGADVLYSPGDIISASQLKSIGAKDILFTDKIEIDFDLYYDGNYPSIGKGRWVEHVSPEDELLENWFSKYGYTWLYWWSYPEGNYKMLAQGRPTLAEMFEANIENRNYEIDFNTGRLRMVVFAIWDKKPYILTEELYFNIDEIIGRNPDELKEEMESYIYAEDEEDGEIPAKIIDFDYEELCNPALVGGSTSVNCEAFDGAGNRTSALLKIYIESDDVLYDVKGVRYIDEEHYKKSSSTEGALEENSLWYVDEDYVDLILQAFEKLKDV